MKVLLSRTTLFSNSLIVVVRLFPIFVGRKPTKMGAIADDARWDGLHAIVTDRANPQADLTLRTQYRELWQIEDCFRTQKHNLQIRPVYHWKDRRIQAHLTICFMAFCCLQELRFRLRARDLHYPVRELLHRLDQTRLSLVSTNHDKKQYVLTRKIPPELQKLLRSLDLHWPKFSFELPQESGPVPSATTSLKKRTLDRET